MTCNCVYFKRRTKKGVFYGYCTKQRSEVPLNASQCYMCENKEYKKYKPIKKVSKKRIFVSDKTYQIVLEKSKDIFGVPRCGLCNNADNLQLHHIRYRGERKDLIDEPSNCIMLCHRDFSENKCHRLVHSNKKKYQPILLDMNK